MMGEFNFRETLERAQAAKRGETIPKPLTPQRWPRQQPANFDVEAAKQRAREAQRPRTPEDLERLASSL